MISGMGVSLTYDVSNRIWTSTPVSGGTEYYGYAPDNKRVSKTTPAVLNGQTVWNEEWTFYGALGEKLGVYKMIGGPSSTFVLLRRNVWFAGRLISDGGYLIAQDRLGTNRASGARFYPYGEEIGTATANDRVKFATYTRDGFTGLDYADQRYYANTFGRFNTPDPYSAGASAQAPVTWNMYAYGAGDPTNNYDPSGLASCGLLGGDDFDLPGRAGVGCLTGGGHSSGNSFPDWVSTVCKGTGVINGFDPVGSPWCNVFPNYFEPVQYKPPSTPQCDQSVFTAFSLDYSQLLYKNKTQSAQDHIIQRHGGRITGMSAPNASQYFAVTFLQIKNLNAATFLFGREVYDPVRDTFSFIWSVPQVTLGGNHIGTDPSGGESSINQLILKADCKTVITSYPLPGVD